MFPGEVAPRTERRFAWGLDLSGTPPPHHPRLCSSATGQGSFQVGPCWSRTQPWVGNDSAPCLVRGAGQAPRLRSSLSELAHQADLPPMSPQPGCAFLDLQVSKGSGGVFDLGSAGRNLACPGPRAGAASPSPFSVPIRFPGRSLQTPHDPGEAGPEWGS